MTNTPNYISQLEPSAPKEILVEYKVRNDISILSGGTRASVTTERCMPRKNSNMKSPAMSPPRKNPITNQYFNRLITEQYPSLPPVISKYPPG